MSRLSETWVIPASGIWGIEAIWEKTDPSALIFLKLSKFVILTYETLNLLSKMGSVISFNYLKTSFENSKLRDFVPTFGNFIGGWSS